MIKNLQIQYNQLNLVQSVSTTAGAVKASYAYSADGQKQGVKDVAGNGYAYAGSLIYKRDNGVYALEKASISGQEGYTRPL